MGAAADPEALLSWASAATDLDMRNSAYKAYCRRMAGEDLHNWNIVSLNRLKTFVLMLCAAAILLDQVWRVVSLFWNPVSWA